MSEGKDKEGQDEVGGESRGTDGNTVSDSNVFQSALETAHTSRCFN